MKSINTKALMDTIKKLCPSELFLDLSSAAKAKSYTIKTT